MRLRRQFVAIVRQTFGTVVAMLREIFDEAAYARFLARSGVASSSGSYAAFRREFEDVKARRPKCC
jgi:hypothetical protein